jgi:hypothetical protein
MRRWKSSNRHNKKWQGNGIQILTPSDNWFSNDYADIKKHERIYTDSLPFETSHTITIMSVVEHKSN